MGLFDKLKNVFLEEDVDDENETTRQIPKKELGVETPEPVKEVKKEVKREVRDDKPIIKQIENESISDRSLFDTKDNFKFPIIFEEDDYKEEKKKTKSVNVLERPTTISKYEVKETKPQKFKPSPVISPVYGVLDKNYVKEDIVSKDGLLNDTTLDIDKVIQKAYGDESKVVITREEKKKTEIEKDTKPVVEQQITQTVAVVPKKEEKEPVLDKNLTLEELDEKIKNIDELLSETTDDDFYSLVDSMYQDKEEE